MRRLRETLMAYVNVWGAGIDTYSPRIRDAIARVSRIKPEGWRTVALAGLDTEATEETVQAVVNPGVAHGRSAA